MNVLQYLQGQFAAALTPITAKAADYSQLVRPAQEIKFGDYQANCAMPLKKEVGGNPRDIAQKIIDNLPNKADFASIEIAGPGFINLKLADDFLAKRLTELLNDDKLGIEPIAEPKTLVIDYSSPNVAKPMHVGHLRSTIIGDSIARTYRALGWKVIADNHLGDWGTQFGMLIYGWRNLRDEKNASENPLKELARLYRLVNELGEKDPAVAQAARAETAKLHEGDAENLALWNQFIPWCLADLAKMYDRLGIRFDYHHGESFYQPMLAATVESLQKAKIATESEGAICVFFPDPSGKVDDEGKPVQLMPPTIVRKADGAFTYATSDLACVDYRVKEWSPDSIVYVVDDRQSLHFKQIFATSRMRKEVNADLVHVEFGKITGKDGKPYKTREGGTVGLETLLDEAVERARAIVDRMNDEEPQEDRLSEEQRKEISEVVGMGAVKYADLCQNRASDYVFDWDKMISLQGNTATYMQNVYARNRAIFRRGGIDPTDLAKEPPAIVADHPSERALAVSLLRYPEAIVQAAADFKPNVITAYLYELANIYNGFYRDCPVLKAEGTNLRRSRLALCELTARTIRQGLDLLGIRTVERM